MILVAGRAHAMQCGFCAHCACSGDYNGSLRFSCGNHAAKSGSSLRETLMFGLFVASCIRARPPVTLCAPRNHCAFRMSTHRN
eukprot:1818550-Pleurochrysis_carterae.AAC.1